MGAVTYKLVELRSSGTWQKEQVSKAISLGTCFFCFRVVGNITSVKALVETLLAKLWT
jgi:hypothetical protein